MNNEEIKDKIRKFHNSDENQLSAIFNEGNLLIDAPAGCGKTKTIISKIAYILSTNEELNFKRILTLSFSINAASNMKREIEEKLPILINDFSKAQKLKSHIVSSNYHGLCRSILENYGYMINESLREINSFTIAEDIGYENDTINRYLIESEKNILLKFDDAVKKYDYAYIESNKSNYINLLKSNLLNNRIITYNGIILFVLEVFRLFPSIKQFYNQYFKYIIVDEFQDTNYISWLLLNEIICKDTNVILVGDSLQRIYGFIGAIPSIFNLAIDRLRLTHIKLNTNYRFSDNRKMLLLDKNLRELSENPINPQIEQNVDLEINLYKDQKMEAYGVIKCILEFLKLNRNICILFKTKAFNKNAECIMNVLDENNIKYFYSMFSEDDSIYKNFHLRTLNEFSSYITDVKILDKKARKKFIEKIKEVYKSDTNKEIQSLIKLLEILITKGISNNKYLGNDDKIEFIMDTLRNKLLKNYIQYVDEKVVISTIHTSKGLEWDYVIIPDFEQFSFPNYKGLCEKCFEFNLSKQSYYECALTINESIINKLKDELSVLYVAVTRAKKDVIFTASKERINGSNRILNAKISCFCKLEGLNFMKNIIE